MLELIVIPIKGGGMKIKVDNISGDEVWIEAQVSVALTPEMQERLLMHHEYINRGRLYKVWNEKESFPLGDYFFWRGIKWVKSPPIEKKFSLTTLSEIESKLKLTFELIKNLKEVKNETT